MSLVHRASRAWREFLQYARSHLWFSLVGTMMLIFLLAALIFQTYLKNQYYDYLMDETWQTENALLAAASVNLNGRLNSALSVGGEIAVNQELRDAVDRVLDSGADQRMRSLMTLSAKLNDMNHYSPDIVNIAILTQDGLLKEYERSWAATVHSSLWADEDSETLRRLYDSVYSRIPKPAAGRYIVVTEPAFHRDFPALQMMHIALPLLGRTTTFRNVSSVVVISFDLSGIVRSGSLSGGSQGHVYGYLTGPDGVIVYHEQKELIGTGEDAYIQEGSRVLLSQKLDYFRWTAHIAIDASQIQNSVDQMYSQGVVIYIVLICLCGAAWNLLMRHILRPIGMIGGAMSEIRSGGAQQKIEVLGTHELWQLAEQYNDMLDALHEQQQEAQRQFEEKARSIEQKNRAEREALESQINAHFLCNTLNAINCNVLESGNDEVAVLLKKLSGILYYTFSRTQAQDVTLGQEIEWVRQYLYLQKYRLGDCFSYEIDFPEEYQEWPCCKLVFQPFVENSILHGFEHMERGGMIWITGRPERDRFRVEVRDNGHGMTTEVSQAVQQSIKTGQALSLDGTGTGIGIRNVITRMKMFFGARFGVRMTTAENRGTCFTFWLPIPPHSGQEEALNDWEEESM